MASSDNPACKKLPPTSGKLLQVRSARPSLESGYYDSDTDIVQSKQPINKNKVGINSVVDHTSETFVEGVEVHDTDSREEISEKSSVKRSSSQTGRNFQLLSPKNKVVPVLPDITVQDVETVDI